MNIVLWVLQILLAVAFLMAGTMKLLQPIDRLGKQMGWVNEVPQGRVRFIGASEALGGLGLILPGALGFAPWLTVAAAVGLAVVMVLAVQFHLARKEKVSPASVLLIVALIVAVGRAFLPV